MCSLETRIGEMGLTLPAAAKPFANYMAYKRVGSMLFVSGQLCTGPDGTLAEYHRGKLGVGVSAEHGRAAALLCALNVLAQVRAAMGDLDDGRLWCVRLGGFINADPTFAALALVMNGASDIMVDLLGDRGTHVRSTVGVAELPLDACVEVEALFSVW